VTSVLLSLNIAMAFGLLGLSAYMLAMLASIGEGLGSEGTNRTENERNVRRLLREISGFSTDVGVRIERQVKIRDRIGVQIEDAVKRARTMLEHVTTRDGEMRSRGMTPERLGLGWGAYFDGASKGELDRIMLRI